MALLIPVRYCRRSSLMTYLKDAALFLSASVVVTLLWTSVLNTNISNAGSATSNSASQLAVLESNPFRFIGIVLNSFPHQGTLWFQGIIGVLGWETLFLPQVFYLGFLAALVFVLFNIVRSSRPSLAPMLVSFLTIASCFSAILLAIYLSFTGVALPYVFGVQGRYLSPLLFVIAAALGYGNRESTRPPKRWSSAATIALLILVAVAIDAVSVTVLVTRYWIH
jgi:uncharacterized membrane protein